MLNRQYIPQCGAAGGGWGIGGAERYQVCQAIDIVEAGIAGRRNDIIEIIGWEAEVGHFLKSPIGVLYVHSVVLQKQHYASSPSFSQEN